MFYKSLDKVNKMWYNIVVSREEKAVISCLEQCRCEKCIWYEKCKASEDLTEECDFFDPLEDDTEDFWNEMSYRRFERSD